MSRAHAVRVEPAPAWVPLDRWLGQTFRREGEAAVAALSAAEAAELAARLRGVALDGAEVRVEISPPLPRPLVRAARTEEARRMRASTPGFTRAGARVDDGSRVGLSPEVLALALGRSAKGARVWDLCCGAGGDAIGFARGGAEVVAIEQRAERVAQARHNAQLYGVATKIRFLTGDALRLAQPAPGELLYLDPPWIEGYREPHTLSAYPLIEAVRAAWPASPLWVKLPAAFATASLPGRWEAVFGEYEGDRRRIKYLIGRIPPEDPP